eukprot:4767805-Prymnesium_polylepis.1
MRAASHSLRRCASGRPRPLLAPRSTRSRRACGATWSRTLRPSRTRCTSCSPRTASASPSATPPRRASRRPRWSRDDTRRSHAGGDGSGYTGRHQRGAVKVMDVRGDRRRDRLAVSASSPGSSRSCVSCAVGVGCWEIGTVRMSRM